MIEGYLNEMPSGRFELLDKHDKHIMYFTCGSPIEIYYNGEWIIGRVEADIKGNYYFYGADKPYLHNGMRARVK